MAIPAAPSQKHQMQPHVRSSRHARASVWVMSSSLGRSVAVCLLLAACSKNDNHMEGTVAPPGKTNAFDPSASLAEVTTFAGTNAKLVSIEARGVRSDGTMDLEAQYYPSAEYKFVRPPAPVDRSKYPVGTVPESSSEEATVSVRKSSVVDMGNQGQKIDRGMAITNTRAADKSDVPVASPRCTFAVLWATAIAQGAPRDAVARITYQHDVYEFSVENTAFSYRFDDACKPATRPTTSPAATIPPPVEAVTASPPVVAPKHRRE